MDLPPHVAPQACHNLTIAQWTYRVNHFVQCSSCLLQPETKTEVCEATGYHVA